jgi:hypothetical protein
MFQGGIARGTHSSPKQRTRRERSMAKKAKKPAKKAPKKTMMAK